MNLNFKAQLELIATNFHHHPQTMYCLIIEAFVEEVHRRVKEDMMGGNPFHRQMEVVAHEVGAWENKRVNFGCYGGEV